MYPKYYWIYVKKATGDADMLIVKEALVKAEEFDSVVLNSRDTDVFIALLHHLDGDIHKNVNKERVERPCFH